MGWAEAETDSATLPDARLKRRLTRVLDQLSTQPTESIPVASGTWADTKAAYRLFDNDRVDAVDILDGHSRATLQGIAGEPVVLLVQDTTFLSDIRDLQGRGVGTLRLTKRAEYLLHSSVAFSESRVNLGVLGHHFWQRPEERTGRWRERCLLEEKESYRWLLGYDMACALQALNPHTLVMNVADREGDIDEWFLAGEFDERVPDRAGYLIRAKCNRRVTPGEHGSLWELLARVPVLGQTTVSIKRRPGRRARVATLNVRSRTVTFHRARRRGRSPAPVTVNTIYLQEAHPPAGETALEWMLLTNLPVDHFAAAQRLIGCYQARWEIEWYFRIHADQADMGRQSLRFSGLAALLSPR
ncbi:MAG TPA: IS4 family transposase [Candidatus Competibacter sp.]|nr:IS4 family transposase [Candidatus Competibacter sp.]